MSALVDAHVHVWDPRRLDYPWLAGTAVDGPHLPDVVDRATGHAAGPTARMVFVQADCRADQSFAEAEWVASLADGWPELAGIVAAVDLRDPALEAALDRLAELPGRVPVVGIRHLLQSEPDETFADERVAHGLGVLAARGLTFDACVRHAQLPLLEHLLAPVDGLRVVLDHLGKPPVDAGIDGRAIDGEAGQRWADAITRLARLPGLHVKVSGLSAEASDRAILDAHGAPFLRHAVDAFGADRAMVGSDWPVSASFGAGGSFASFLDLVLDAVGPSAGERAALLKGTATRFYGLDRA
ncbi:amidohydrolase family protein [Agromyces sp. MMS24-JH15]|uniref:amidohydrolase family protein n=1 Tax=Agromyces sp. MMS24-JH15 TaxID=3243765 RepID=UPI0037498ED5